MKVKVWDKKLGGHVKVSPAIVAHPVLGSRYQKSRPRKRGADVEAGTVPAGKEAGS